MTHAELIDDLVAANHILAHRRIFEAYGHISARDPRNPDRYWLTRSMPPAEVAAEDIIEFDLDNKPLRAGENRLFFERVIHGEVYKARSDVMAVCHNHSPSLIPFCNSKTRLRPMVGNAAFLGEGAPVFDIRSVDDEGDLNVCTVAQASAMAQWWSAKRCASACAMPLSRKPMRASRSRPRFWGRCASSPTARSPTRGVRSRRMRIAPGSTGSGRR
jgi:ribulose-5-phosphate 4-epimerase/fuculose-1-phosphate aldolase